MNEMMNVKALAQPIVSAQERPASVNNNEEINNKVTTLNILDLQYLPQNGEGFMPVVTDVAAHIYFCLSAFNATQRCQQYVFTVYYWEVT